MLLLVFGVVSLCTQNLTLQLLFHFDNGERFDDVAHLNIVEVDDTYTALETRRHFFHVVFIAFQGVDVAGMNHDAVTNKAGFVHAVHLSFGNNCSCNGAHSRYLVNFAYFYLARHYFFLHLIEHALHSRVHVVDGVVDNRIGVYLHPSLGALGNPR